MYVCICNGYRESELREVARGGIHRVEDCYLALGEGPCCGRCLDVARTIIDEERGRAGSRTDPGLPLPALEGAAA